MSKILRHYPPVKVTGMSFKGVVRTVVPNQSMSLKTIVEKFVRREALPVQKEGFYQEGLGDLEKYRNEDITEKVERVDALKAVVKKGKAAEQERLKKQGEEQRRMQSEELRKLAAEELAKKPQGPANSPPV